MSMLSIVQNFIGQVSGTINDQNNPLGLSPGQIDEINQILTIIKNLISDGIQRNDINKMVTLLGEIAEAIPEMQAEIKEIITGLKKLAKKLFETMDLKTGPSMEGSLRMASDMIASDSSLDSGMLSDDTVISNVSANLGRAPGDIIIDQAILNETSEDRLKIAEQILNIINDKMILSQTNFNAITKGLNAIKNRASLETNGVNDNRIDGSSANQSLF